MIGCWGEIFKIPEEEILTDFFRLKDLTFVEVEKGQEVGKKSEGQFRDYFSKVNLVLDGADLLKRNVTITSAVTQYFEYVLTNLTILLSYLSLEPHNEALIASN